MKKLMMMVVLAGASALLQAADAVAPAKAVRTPEEQAAIRAKIKDAYYRNTGGRVVRPDSGRGKIVFVDARSGLPQGTLKGLVDEIALLFAVRMEVVEGEAGTVAEFSGRAAKTRGAATVFVVNDAAMPLSLVAYEAGWGVVNVADLGAGAEGVRTARLRKLLARTFAQTCGVAYASGTSGLMAPVRKAAELDGCVLPERPTPMLVGPIHRYLANYGVAPTRVAIYRVACTEGWAPAPTNEVQTVLWDKAKEKREKGPSRPLTIPPPGKNSKKQ